MRPTTPTHRLFSRALGLAVLALAVIAAPAAAAGLGPDAGASSNADGIRTAYWVMLVVAVLLTVVLVGGLLLAARRFRARDDAPPRRLTAGRGTVAKAGGILGVLAAAIFVFGVVMTSEARDTGSSEAEPVDINVVGQQWLWRFEYPQEASSGASPGIATVFSYNELVLPADTPVNLTFTSTDVLHRWFIPELGGQVEAVPGESVEVSFVADEGVYEGQSTQFSGSGHPALRARVRVVSPDEYQQYVEQLAEDLSAAQDAVASEAVAGEDTPAEEQDADAERSEEQ